MTAVPDPLAGLDWENLRYLLAMSRGGSLAEAARLIGVDQSTVSRRLRALERCLGVELVARTGTGYELTTAGRGLLPHAEEGELTIRRLGHRIGATDPAIRPAGTVRLSTIDHLASHLLIPALPAFRRRYPEIDLVIAPDNRHPPLSRVAADVAVHLGRPAQPDVAARRLARVGYALYGAPCYLERHDLGRPFDPAQHQFVGNDETLAHLPQERWLAANCAEGRMVVRTNSLQSLLIAAQAGLGLAVLPCSVAERAAGVSPVPIDEGPPMRDLWLLVRAGLADQPPVRAVADHLAELAEAQAPTLAGAGVG